MESTVDIVRHHARNVKNWAPAHRNSPHRRPRTCACAGPQPASSPPKPNTAASKDTDNYHYSPKP